MNILSFACAIVVFVLKGLDSTCQLVPLFAPVLRLLPMFALSNSLQTLAQMDVLPAQRYTCDAGNGGAQPFSSYAPYQTAFHPDVTGSGLAFMVVQTFVYLALAIAFDFALRSPRVRRLIDGDPETDNDVAAHEDEDVAAEAARIAALTAPGAPPIKDDVIILDRLRKTYRGGKRAVRGISMASMRPSVAPYTEARAASALARRAAYSAGSVKAAK